MRPFEYVSPKTLPQAVELLSGSWGETEILAGGTDLISLLKDDIVTPRRLVNIKEIKELGYVRYDQKSGLRLGALVTIQEILDDPGIRVDYPAIAEAAEGILSPQVRSTGTLGGELCQRPRCWYFRNGFGLLALGKNGTSTVVDGDNRYHAILGNSGPAYFVSPSILAPPLLALGASVQVVGPKGKREIGIGQFFRIPTTKGEREFNLKPGEIVTEVTVPPPDGALSATYEIRERQVLGWPLATASVNIKIRSKKVRWARVVLGHVAPIPWDSPEAAETLQGEKVDTALAESSGGNAVKHAVDLGRNGYKIHLASVAVKRAVLQATRRERHENRV
ncbi:MAG: FAD binding domain-containing protein [Candidatus Neomarinimicrobiota bacterium]